MFIIKNTIVSLDLIEQFFVCDIDICKGQCCVDGDAGAPLLAEEKLKLDQYIEEIKPFLSPGGLRAIQQEGTSYLDRDGDLVTTLIEGGNCAFSVFNEAGICLCALEKATRLNKLPNLKPSSCYLYPARLTELNDNITAVNFHKWKICRSAQKKGRELGIRAYQFLKVPLINKFGVEWYNELEKVAKEWLAQKGD